jgi:glycosyltransferase involved in cell wall biosynthesis
VKILQVNNSEQIIGGSDRVFHATCALLAADGHEVTSLACGTPGPAAGRKAAYVLARNGYRGRSPLDAIRNAAAFVYRRDAAETVRRIVREHRPDVAHLHIFYGQLTSAVLAALRSERVPIVMSVHEYRMLCPVSTLFRAGRVCEECAGGRYWRAVVNRCNRGRVVDSVLSASECHFRDAFHAYEANVDHFLMVSEFCRQKHLQFMPALERKSSTLHNFVEPGPARADSAPRADAPYLLYAGRLSPEKGVELLLGAIAALPSIPLRIAGTGVLEASLRARWGALPNVTFLGHLGREELARVVAGARYAVVPSTWYENNPMSVLESFAAGVPVVGSTFGGIPELVEDGVTGFLFDPSDPRSLRDALQRAWALGPEALSRMRASCVERVQTRHGPRAHLEALLGVYRSVIPAHA